MKKIAVACNNTHEWNFFCETLEWNLSKQNLPYKRVAKGFQDIHNKITYCLIPNNLYQAKEVTIGVKYDSVIWCCNVDKELEEYLRGCGYE